MFRIVDDSNPPKITIAIGDCISFPGSPPFIAIGINANAEVKAVMIIGFRRSAEPFIILLINSIPSSFRVL